MHPVDIQACLESMEILVDTREQPSERAKKRYESFGCPYSRRKLNYGDYAYNFTFPDGRKAVPDSVQSVCSPVVIERKESLEELSGNLCQNHERFGREFDRAKQMNASVYLLVENASWKKILTGRYKTRFHKNAYTAALLAFIARYDIKPIFCEQELSGKMIHDILYRELKERLERGDYDC